MSMTEADKRTVSSYSKVEADNVDTDIEMAVVEEPSSLVSAVKITGDTSASFSELFSTADTSDYVFMGIGTLASIVTGVSFPAINILFGQMINALNGDSNEFAANIEKLALYFVYVAIANMFSCGIQVGCWSVAGERQSQKLREKYVKAILSQEIGWFDVNGAAELSTKVAEYTGKVQDGISRKVSDLFQYGSQFIGSFIVGFYLNWRLTVVLLAAFPLIAGAGSFMINAITAAQNKSSENYAKAGGLANESLSAVRTVTALNG